MTSASATTVRLHRDPATTLLNPTLEDVHAIMSQIRLEQTHPCLSLQYIDQASLPDSLRAELFIARLNNCDSASLAGWLVQYRRTGEKRSTVLAVGRASESALVRRRVELLGCHEDIRSDCIVATESVGAAIRWFLESGMQNPNLRWCDFLDSVRGP